MERLANKRNRRIDHYLHTASKRIIDVLVKEDIGVVCIGKNDAWKQEANMGKRVKRGLYRVSNGRYVNADINGAGNIIRKVTPDAFHQVEGVEDGKGLFASLVVHPVRIVIPRTKPKSKRLIAEASGQ